MAMRIHRRIAAAATAVVRPTASAALKSSLMSSIPAGAGVGARVDPMRTDPLARFGLLDASAASGPSVSSVSANGFTVARMRINGPLLIVDDAIFLWDVPQYGVGGPEPASTPAPDSTNAAVVDNPDSPFHGWSTDLFKVFEHVDPTPDILVIGTGAQMVMLPPLLRKYIISLGMQVEVQKTQQAASTFNVLQQEGRRPAAALLPVVPTSARTGKPLVSLVRKTNTVFDSPSS